MTVRSGVFVVVLAGFSLLFLGCASQKTAQQAQQQSQQPPQQQQKQTPPNYLNPLTYLDAANNLMIEVTGSWDLGMGTLEYVGDKTEESHQFLEDVYQSL